MLERTEFVGRHAAFVASFPLIPYCVAGSGVAAVAVPWMIAAAPAANVAAGEAALATAILALLVAAARLAAADWWAEKKSRRDWVAMRKAADVTPAPGGAPAPHAEYYAPAVCNDALCVHFRAHRHAVRSNAPEPTIDSKSEEATSLSIDSDAPLPATAPMAFSTAQAQRSAAPDTSADASVPPTAGPAGKAGPNRLHARAQLVGAIRIRRRAQLRACLATQNRLVANGGAWRTWPSSDQRCQSHTIPLKIVSNIIVLGQGNRPSPDGADAPGPEPSDGTFSGGSNGAQHPRARIKSLSPEVSLDAKRQLIALAEALARQAAREDEAAERLAERSRSPPDAPAENSPRRDAKEDTS